MRYIIILVSFTLCSKCLVVSDNVETKFRFIPKNPSVSIQNGIDVSEDKTHDDSQHFDKIVNRQRRSIWTTFINHLTAVSETFHMKPLLAEGLNDMDSFGKTFQKEINKNKDFTNVMLSKDAENEEKLSKKVNENEKTKNSEEELKKPNSIFENEEKNREVNAILNSLIRWNNEVVEMEEKMLEELQTEFKIKSEDLKNIYSKGSNLIETEDVFKNHIAGNPELEDYVKSVVGAIRRWRERMIQIEARLPKSPLSGFTKKEADVIDSKLAYIKESNQKWILGKGRSNVVEEIPEEVDDRFGLEESEKLNEKDTKVNPDEEKLKKLRSDWKYFNVLHYLAQDMEDEAIELIIKNRGDIEKEDLMHLYHTGLNLIASDKYYQKIIANKPEVKDQIEGDLEFIRGMRTEMKKVEKNLDIVPGLTRAEIEDIELKRNFVNDLNNNWIIGKRRPKIGL